MAAAVAGQKDYRAAANSPAIVQIRRIAEGSAQFDLLDPLQTVHLVKAAAAYHPENSLSHRFPDPFPDVPSCRAPAAARFASSHCAGEFSARSWPQAAAISRPRLSRTVAVTLPSSTSALKASTRARSLPLKPAPGKGLKQIRLSLARIGASSLTRRRASASESLTPASITYSKVTRRRPRSSRAQVSSSCLSG